MQKSTNKTIFINYIIVNAMHFIHFIQFILPYYQLSNLNNKYIYLSYIEIISEMESITFIGTRKKNISTFKYFYISFIQFCKIIIIFVFHLSTKENIIHIIIIIIDRPQTLYYNKSNISTYNNVVFIVHSSCRYLCTTW